MCRAVHALSFSCAALLVLAGLAFAAEPNAPPDGEELALLKTFRDEFVELTPGKDPFPQSFSMGSDASPAEQPRHQVSLKPFAIARYEVPQNLWQAVMGANPSRWKGPRNSVEMFSWDEAAEFCRRATERLRAAKLIDAKQMVRLPSEAEWEYAAKAGTTSRYSFGDGVADLDAHAWSTRNAAGNDPAVGVLKPNPWELYDVHGYLWEWCADNWHDDYRGAPADGSAWTSGGDPERRVLRGGSWKDLAEQLTSTYRRSADRTTKDDAVGLRCVLSGE